MDTATLWETIQRRHDDIAHQLSDANINQDNVLSFKKIFLY